MRPNDPLVSGSMKGIYGSQPPVAWMGANLSLKVTQAASARRLRSGNLERGSLTVARCVRVASSGANVSFTISRTTNSCPSVAPLLSRESHP